MFRFGKKQEEKTYPNFSPLYIRISSLYNRINFNKCELFSSPKIISFNVIEIYNNSKDICFKFNSNNGPIIFKIKTIGEEEYKNYRLCYINEQTKWMFEINIGPEYTGVSPRLGDKIIAIDIDLALLEVETLIDEIIMETKTNLDIHLKELKKLENLDFSEE